MSILELYKNRRQAFSYKLDEHIKEETILECFKNAQIETPSKQNEQPYKVTIFGPDCKDIKEKIYKKVVDKHRRMQQKSVDRNLSATKLKPHDTINQLSDDQRLGNINVNYKHVLDNSYLAVFSQRLITNPNQYNLNIAESGGHYLEHADPLELKNNEKQVAIEVGLFADAVSLFLLERGIGSSYHCCFQPDADNFIDIPHVTDYIKNGPCEGQVVGTVFLMMSIGIVNLTKRQYLKKLEKDTSKTLLWSSDHYKSNTKPSFETIIKIHKK